MDKPEGDLAARDELAKRLERWTSAENKEERDAAE